MDFLENPFFILNTTPYDNDARIMDLAVAGGLFKNPARCREARSILMSPRKRIYAEIAWLPVKSSEQAKQICELLKSSEGNLGKSDRLRQVQDVLDTDELMPIAKCNVLAAGLSRLPRRSSDEVATWILEIIWACEGIDAEEVRSVINTDRRTSGFPTANPPPIEAELQHREKDYRQVMTSALKNLSADERAEAMTRIVELATADEKPLPRLIDRLVDWYEEDADASLEEHEGKIGELDEKLRLAADEDRPDSVLVSLVNQLIQEVKNWDAIAQPIQLSKTSQGLPQNESETLVRRVQDLAMHLFDVYDKLDLCLQLIRTLQEAFEEVIEISNRLSVVMGGLNATAQKRERCAREKIESQLKKMRANVHLNKADCTLTPMVDKLIQSVTNWKTSAKLCGKYYADHYIEKVANLVHELARHLLGEHSKVDDSRKLFEMLQEKFADVDQIVTLVAEDIKALEAPERARLDVQVQAGKLRDAADAKQPDSNLSETVSQLIQAVNEWKDWAQPIEAYSTDYLNVVHLVVELAFQLRITLGKIDISRLLFKRLQEVFSEIRGYADSIAEHSNALEEAERALGRITIQVKELRGTDVAEKPDPDLSRMVNQLIQSVKEWKDWAQPIKAYYANYPKGAHPVTDLALDLQTEHGKLHSSRQLTEMLQDIFGEIPEIATLLAEDAKTQDETVKKHALRVAKSLFEKYICRMRSKE